MVKAKCIRDCYCGVPGQRYRKDSVYTLPENFPMARHFEVLEGKFDEPKEKKVAVSVPDNPLKK